MNKRAFYFLFWPLPPLFPPASFIFPGRLLTPDALVKNSELGRQGFSLPVTEVVSPRHKIKAYLLTDTTNPIVSLSFVF